jgi:hypothetical protein
MCVPLEIKENCEATYATLTGTLASFLPAIPDMAA